MIRILLNNRRDWWQLAVALIVGVAVGLAVMGVA